MTLAQEIKDLVDSVKKGINGRESKGLVEFQAFQAKRNSLHGKIPLSNDLPDLKAALEMVNEALKEVASPVSLKAAGVGGGLAAGGAYMAKCSFFSTFAFGVGGAIAGICAGFAFDSEGDGGFKKTAYVSLYQLQVKLDTRIIFLSHSQRAEAKGSDSAETQTGLKHRPGKMG